AQAAGIASIRAGPGRADRGRRIAGVIQAYRYSVQRRSDGVAIGDVAHDGEFQVALLERVQLEAANRFAVGTQETGLRFFVGRGKVQVVAAGVNGIAHVFRFFKITEGAAGLVDIESAHADASVGAE